MAERDMKNAPNLAGWAIAAAAGLVAFGVSYLVGGFAVTPSVFFGLVIAVIVGVILGMPREALPGPVSKSGDAPRTADVPAKAAQEAASSKAAPAATAPSQPLMAEPAIPAAAPAPIAAAVSADGPVRLSAPRGGNADNLKEIEGIGPALEKLCNEMGFWHFDQIANWSDADVAWVDANMKNFKGRIIRDKWVAQAKLIVSEGLEAFRVRAKTNDY